MAKLTLKKSLNFVMWLVGVIAALGIGGLFLNGTFASVMILKWLPLIVHTVVGWLIIITTLVAAVAALMKKI